MADLPPLPPGATLDAPGAGMPPLPPGATLDAIPPLPPGATPDQPAPAAPQPGLGARALGEAERGMVGAATGLASTAQAAGRWLDNHTTGFLPGLDTPHADNVDIQGIGQRALDRDGAYQPKELSGKLVEGATAGLTGAALTGGIGLAGAGAGVAKTAAPLVFGAASGAVPAAAKALGATDNEADLAGLAAGFGGLGAAAARTAAGKAVKNYAAGRAAASMSDDDAIHTVLMNDAIKQYQAGATGAPATSFQAAGAYKKDLNAAIGQYGRTGAQSGALAPSAVNDLATARSAANAHTNALSDAPNGSYDNLQSPGALPDTHLPVVSTALEQLDRISPQQFKKGATGPFTGLATKLAPYAGTASALAAASAGHFSPVVDLAAAGGGVAAHMMAPAIIPKIGNIADRVLGTAVTPAEAALAGAQRRIADNGLTVPQAPLPAVQGLVGSNRQLIADNATAAAAQDAADKDYLYQYADAQHMNRQFDMSQRQQRAYEVADATAMDRQRTQAAQRAAAQQARGLNLSEGAGAWLERQQIQAAKQANPGVPITGAAALSARGPQEVFDATGGRYGSPADPDEASLFADAGSQTQAPGAPPAGRIGAATGPSQGAPVGLPVDRR